MTASGSTIDVIDKSSARLVAPFVPAKDSKWLQEHETVFNTIRTDWDTELTSKHTSLINVTLPGGTVMGVDFNLTSWRLTRGP